MALVQFDSIQASQSIQTLQSFLGTGNTAGNTTITGGDIYISGGNNITISMTSNTIRIDGGAGGGGGGGLSNINLSAGTTSNNLSNLVFNNSNGVSFGLDGSTITAIVATNYQSQGAYLTTAMQSNAVTLSNIRVSAGTTSNLLSAISFNNGNGVTFGLDAGTITVSHNGLTTARASNDAIGLNSALTANGVLVTANSSGLSLNFPAFLTTAAQSNHSHNFATTTTNGASIIVATTNSNGVTIAVPAYLTTAQSVGAYLTTAAQSNQVVNSLNGSTGQISLNVGSSLSSSTNGSSITFGLASNITTALQSAGAYLTTARASNDGIGLNTAQTNVTWTVNSAGISLNAANYAGVGTSATNASITLNSNGLAISVAAPGGGGAVNFSGGTTSNNLQTIVFSNNNGVSFGLDGSTMTASVVGAAGATRNFYNPYGDLVKVAAQVGQGTMNINPNDFPNCTFDRVYMPLNITNSSNSSGSHTLSFWLGLYTRNVSTLSLVSSQSTSYALTHSGTVGSYSLYSGMRHISMGFSTSLSEGLYYMAVVSRTTSGGANGSYSQMCISDLNSNFLGHFSSAHNTTMQFRPGFGVYSVTTSGMPDSIGISQIRGSDSAGFRAPIVIFANSTI